MVVGWHPLRHTHTIAAYRYNNTRWLPSGSVGPAVPVFGRHMWASTQWIQLAARAIEPDYLGDCSCLKIGLGSHLWEDNYW